MHANGQPMLSFYQLTEEEGKTATESSSNLHFNWMLGNEIVSHRLSASIVLKFFKNVPMQSPTTAPSNP
jgi:hypothetical protein